ncbi:mitochondrial proton/calcium exchanger protein-like protein isoform X1 [Tanacetum coccineum]
MDLFHIPNITIDQVMLRAFPMSLTGAASCWLRNKPSGSITTWEDLKTKFLSKYCPPACTAKKMEEINNFQQEPDENLYQAWERFKDLLMKWSLNTNFNQSLQVLVLFYNGIGFPTIQILDSRVTESSDGLAAIQAQLNNLGREIKKVNEKVYDAQVGCEQCKRGGYRTTALGFYQRNNTNPSYQERRQTMEETLSKFMSESAKRHEENSNLFKEIRASTDAAIRNQGASIKNLKIQIGRSISTIVEADLYPIRHMGFSQYAVSTGHNRTLMYETKQMTILFPNHLNGYCCEEKKGSYGPQFSEAYSEASHINNSIPRKEKDPGGFTLHCFINNVCFDNALADLGASPLILERPFLSIAHAKIDVFKRKITLRVGDEKIIFKSVKRATSLIKRVYTLSLRERMELDLEARLMGETLVLNRSLDPLYGDYIELNDLNVPLELRRDQVDDLMPTIEEGEVINEPMIDISKTWNNESFDEEFYNSIIRDKVKLIGKNVVRAFMNVPVFIGKFSVVTHFVVVENMDGYRDQDMGDIILEEPFCKASCVEAKRFDGLITMHNGSDNNEAGFLDLGGGGGKMKNSKDSVIPSVMSDSGNATIEVELPSVVDETVVKEKQCPLVNTTVEDLIHHRS